VGALFLIGAEAFALSGTVKDTQGVAIAGATVSLVSDTLARATTDATGAFKIERPVSIGPGGESRVAGLHLSMPSAIASGTLSLFSLRGDREAEVPLGPLAAGSHRVELPPLAPGMYSLRMTLGPYSASATLVHAGTSTFLMGADRAGAAGPALVLRRQSAAAVDSLRVRKTGFVAAKVPVESYAQEGIAVVLAADTGGITPLPPITDYSAAGPFATVVEANVGPNNAYTIFRPEPLGANGFIHAPMIYGHGIGGQVSGFSNFLRNVASHGFVIIGCNILNGGPNSPANNTAMTTGLNWLLQQNATAGSKFQGKLAVKRASSMGYSVGGTAAVDIGGHEAIITVVSIHGHISTATLHGTLLQTSGTKDNVGLPMQQQTFANSKVQTFLGTVTNADHGYISQNNGGAERPAIVAWLRYWIYNDTGARNYFYGNDCVMCKAPWENPQRKLWQ
jgi:dienelactone hydrolase